MRKILLTGAAGFIGSHVAERLLDRGDTVIGLDNFDPYYPQAIKRSNLASAQQYPAFTFFDADIRDLEVLREIAYDAKPDVMVHLAARAGVRASLEQPELYHRVNVIGTQHVLDVCREIKPSHAVLASSSSVYSGSREIPFREDTAADRPISPYAATKRMNELMAHVYSHVYGLNTTLLRFFTVYGPRQRPDMAIHKFARLIEAGRPIPMYGTGDTVRDYTYVDDIVTGVLCAIDRPFRYEIVNLGAGRITDLRAMIRQLGSALGRMAVIDEQPPQPGDAAATQADISKAGRLLGYAPSTTLEEGLKHFVAWFRSGSSDAAAQATAG